MGRLLVRLGPKCPPPYHLLFVDRASAPLEGPEGTFSLRRGRTEAVFGEEGEDGEEGKAVPFKIIKERYIFRE